MNTARASKVILGVLMGGVLLLLWLNSALLAQQTTPPPEPPTLEPPTATFTPTFTETPSLTPVLSTETFTIAPTLTDTATLLPTDTASATATETLVDLSSPTLTPTLTLDASQMVTETPSVTPTVSETASITATLPTEFALLHSDDFSSPEVAAWLLNHNWSHNSFDGGVLFAYHTLAEANFVLENLYNVAAQARFHIEHGAVRLTVRRSIAGGYTLNVNSNGEIQLYRGDAVWQVSNVIPTLDGWYTLRLQALEDAVRAFVNGVEVFNVVDDFLLPPGTVSLGIDEFGFSTVDSVDVYVPVAELSDTQISLEAAIQHELALRVNREQAYASPLSQFEAQTSSLGRIVFSMRYLNPHPTIEPRLGIINGDGSNFTQLDIANTEENNPSLSPDGSKIAFAPFPLCHPTHCGQLFVVNVDGTGLQQLTPPDFGTSNIRKFAVDWSPDGTKLVYTGERYGGGTAIFVFDIASGVSQQLTDWVGSNGYPSWSPDGTRIAFSRNPTQTTHGADIYVVNADGSNQLRLGGTQWGDYYATWSPNGTHIAFAGVEYTGYSPYYYKSDIYMLNVSNPTSVTQLTFSEQIPVTPAYPGYPTSYSRPNEHREPDWSPSSNQIVYQHHPLNTTSTLSDDTFDLYVINLDTGTTSPIFVSSAYEYDPSWGGAPIVPTLTPTRSATLTRTRTPTITGTRSNTPTRTTTPSITGTRSRTPTRTPTITGTRSVTPSRTRTPTITGTRSNTPTRTPSVTGTRSNTPTRTPSLTRTPTATYTPTLPICSGGAALQSVEGEVSAQGTQVCQLPSNTPSRTPSRTSTRTPTRTRTPSPTLTPTPVAPTLSDYGITLISDGQQWDAAEQLNILTGANRVSNALSLFGTIGNTLPAKFKTVMGNTITFLRLAEVRPSGTIYGIYYDVFDQQTPTSGYCQVFDETVVINTITVACRGAILQTSTWITNGLVTEYAAVHELGHVLDIRSETQLRIYVGDAEELTLADCSRDRVMGIAAGQSWERGQRGWGSTSPNSSNGQNISQFQQNPQNTPVEAAADMFLNWVYRRTSDSAPTNIPIPFDPLAANNDDPPPADACNYPLQGTWEGFRNIRRDGSNDNSRPGNVRYWWIEGTLDTIFRTQNWK